MGTKSTLTKIANSAPFCESFPPVVGKHARLIIFGSMPGALSLQAQQYYAHPRNLFWPIMGKLVGASLDLAYTDRLDHLRNAGIALWDVLRFCTRRGSLDSAIKEEVANDCAAFFAKHKTISHVFFNGAKAEQAFLRHVSPTLGHLNLTLHRLPSTSPAHAGMSFAQKLDAWRVITEVGRR